jgi:alpha-tubulin suppressor-like RCC1 family protein
LATKTDGTLWSWGYNGQGQLGHNDVTAAPGSPKQVGTDTDWNGVSGSETVICATKTTGTLWTWGRGTAGQLGLNQNTQRSSPTQVGTDTTWTDVAGGYRSAIATKTDGTLWSWGYNAHGGLGQNDKTERSSPIQITGTNWDNTIIDGAKYGKQQYVIYKKV